MFDVSKIEINAAFYEVFESVFGEDFFSVLTKVRPNGRIQALRSRATKLVKEKDENGETVEKAIQDYTVLDEDEQKEITDYNISVGLLMRKYTSRIAYIGSLLFKKKYNGSKEDYYGWLATQEPGAFINNETMSAIWEKVNLDQKVPVSVKNE